jgi:hypothetical protein
MDRGVKKENLPYEGTKVPFSRPTPSIHRLVLAKVDHADAMWQH